MSDITPGSGGLVFGTAGHIDHGKTTLVRALTGIDTDRLAEEKKRGISIDLGFAHLALPDGRRVAFVDVPGHERFIKNMLAGAGGIDAVVLVVAADEGVKPQTREHFEICRLLGIGAGIVVLTKADLVEDGRIDAVSEQVQQLCVGSALENAEMICVSAHTGTGLSDFKAALMRLAKTIEPRCSRSFPRLPIDRSFTMKGFGTVVTGTLWSGALKPGDTIEVHPLRQSFRIRGLQVHGNPVAAATAGQRTAVNLAGIEAHQLHRGFVITQPETFEGTGLFDCAIEWLDMARAQRARQLLHLHIGTSEMMADVRLLGSITETRTYTRISVHDRLIALPHDRFVLRTAEATVGGGGVLDPFPPVRLNRQATLKRLGMLEPGDEDVRLELLVNESTQGRRIPNIVRATGWTPEEVQKRVKANARLLMTDTGQRVLSMAWLEQKYHQIASWLANFHANQPGMKGAPLHQIRNAVMSGLEPSLTDFVLRSMAEVVVSGESVALIAFKAKVAPEDQQLRERLAAIYQKAWFQPPVASEAFASLKIDAQRARAALEALVKEKRLVRVSADFLFHADAIAHIRKSLAPYKGRQFSIPEFKEWTQVSRKYAIPLLEFLDRERVTRRAGDGRVVL